MNYQLPRYGTHKKCYLSNEDMDIYVVKSFQPQQWIFDNGKIRPWHAEYPIMSVPHTPIPLLTSYYKSINK